MGYSDEPQFDFPEMIYSELSLLRRMPGLDEQRSFFRAEIFALEIWHVHSTQANPSWASFPALELSFKGI